VTGELARDLIRWPARRWAVAAGSALGYAVLVAVPTDLVDTDLFWREIPPTWWAWPALAVTSLLAGLLAATYVAAGSPPEGRARDGRPTRGGYAGVLLTYFAVGCPVCNKLVLVALGSAGAVTWFEPVQPVLQGAAVLLLLWALRQRLRGERACRMPSISRRTLDAQHHP
jgi:hypothetical protein